MVFDFLTKYLIVPKAAGTLKKQLIDLIRCVGEYLCVIEVVLLKYHILGFQRKCIFRNDCVICADRPL